MFSLKQTLYLTKVRVIFGYLNKNVIQQAHNIYTLAIKYTKEQNQDEQEKQSQKFTSDFQFNAYTLKSLLNLKMRIINQPKLYSVNSILNLDLSSAIKLLKFLISTEFSVKGEKFYLGYMTDFDSKAKPAKKNGIFKHRSSDPEQRFINFEEAESSKSNWLVLSWKKKRGNSHLYITLMGDLVERDSFITAILEWKVLFYKLINAGQLMDHITVSHCISSQFEIQNQMTYQINDDVRFSYGVKSNLKQRGRHIGMGISFNL